MTLVFRSIVAIVALVGTSIGCGAAPETGTSETLTEIQSQDLLTVDSGAAVDGTPIRNACTSSLGTAISGYGRLDGTIYSVDFPGTHQCGGGNSHLHLQVAANGGVYDFAVNLAGLSAAVDHAAVGSAYASGWHKGESLDYARDLGLHSSAFATTSAATLAHELANVNHVSVYGTGFSHGGAHLIHRSTSGGGHDGAVVLHPTVGPARYVTFRFSSQSF